VNGGNKGLEVVIRREGEVRWWNVFETKEEEYGGALKTFVARDHAPGCGCGNGRPMVLTAVLK
jgi:hypothetical protein